MRLVDLDQEITVIIYDESLEEYREKDVTLDELLQAFTDYKHLFVYNVDADFLGNFECK